MALEIPEPTEGWLARSEPGKCSNCGDEGPVVFGPFFDDLVCWNCYWQVTGE
jgi:hypothetical protein